MAILSRPDHSYLLSGEEPIARTVAIHILKQTTLDIYAWSHQCFKSLFNFHAYDHFICKCFDFRKLFGMSWNLIG